MTGLSFPLRMVPLVAICLWLLGAAGGLAELAPIPKKKPAIYPAWWFERAVIRKSNLKTADPRWPEDYVVVDDFGELTRGELRVFVEAASREFGRLLRSLAGAGDTADTVSEDGTHPPFIEPAPAVSLLVRLTNATAADDFAAVTVSELKVAAEPFYRLLPHIRRQAAGALTGAPSPADEIAIATMGEAKRVFSFALASADSDRDGLPDEWEELYFGSLEYGPSDDPDSDGLDNMTEYRRHTNPATPTPGGHWKIIMYAHENPDGSNDLSWAGDVEFGSTMPIESQRSDGTWEVIARVPATDRYYHVPPHGK